LLLCYNPYWLWDAGFQLSYIAVLSLVIFMKPVYNCIYVKNKFLDLVWNLSSVTLAAQVLTFPLCIYLFHQFPIYFLLTNLVAIPLSSLVLLVEIFLSCVSFLPLLAGQVGSLIQSLIIIMNGFITHMEKFPFSTVNGLFISLPVTLMMYAVIAAFSVFLFQKNRNAFLL